MENSAIPPLRSLEELTKNSLSVIPNLLVTDSSAEQFEVERSVYRLYESLHKKLRLDQELPQLDRKKHEKYLLDHIKYLPTSYENLDSSRPWLCYWMVHALSLLQIGLDTTTKLQMARFLSKCQNKTGGFGGGPGQISHLATTYAAVNALVILGIEEAYKVIDRKALKEFLLSLKQPDGSFAMHVDGEIDIRGAYCALSVASLTRILCDELCEGTGEWIVCCQTYEGGFAGCPGMEAHGGYSFCALSALVILAKGHLMDHNAFLRWLVNRQMRLEGGFQGRTNKLVDGCYSFWQGGAFPIIYSLMFEESDLPKGHLFDNRALQEYLLICCQHRDGGLLDKPGKPRDIYHTCYALSGLSVAQNYLNKKEILGPLENTIAMTHPLYNIRPDLVKKAVVYFNDSNLKEVTS